jgi:hypothetical protein
VKGFIIFSQKYIFTVIVISFIILYTFEFQKDLVNVFVKWDHFSYLDFSKTVLLISCSHCRNQDFWVGGPKNFFLSQMNSIVSKFITKLYFLLKWFFCANCTSHWFEKFEYIKPWLQYMTHVKLWKLKRLNCLLFN